MQSVPTSGPCMGPRPARALKLRAVPHDRPIDVSFHGSGSVACEDRDGACPFGGSSTPVTGPAGRWPPSQLWAKTGPRALSQVRAIDVASSPELIISSGTDF